MRQRRSVLTMRSAQTTLVGSCVASLAVVARFAAYNAVVLRRRVDLREWRCFVRVIVYGTLGFLSLRPVAGDSLLGVGGWICHGACCGRRASRSESKGAAGQQQQQRMMILLLTPASRQAILRSDSSKRLACNVLVGVGA